MPEATRDRTRPNRGAGRFAGRWEEVGTGEYVAVIIPASGGEPVIHRFETEAEMLEQHRRSVGEVDDADDAEALSGAEPA